MSFYLYFYCICTCKSPQRVGQVEFFILALPFISSLQVIVDTSDFVRGLKSQPTDDTLSMKGAWLLSRDVFNFRKKR